MKITDSVKNQPTRAPGSTSASKTQGTSVSSNASSVASPQETAPGTAGVASSSPQLQALQSSIASTSTFDVQKVESIKQAIANGQFSVDTGKVAAGLITSVQGLLQAGGTHA